MTLDQKRDRVAELLGHPVPDTIDGIAALWEQHCNGWDFEMFHKVGHQVWINYWPTGRKPEQMMVAATTEYEARLTLLLAVLEAKGKP